MRYSLILMPFCTISVFAQPVTMAEDATTSITSVQQGDVTTAVTTPFSTDDDYDPSITLGDEPYIFNEPAYLDRPVFDPIKLTDGFDHVLPRDTTAEMGKKHKKHQHKFSYHAGPTLCKAKFKHSRLWVKGGTACADAFFLAMAKGNDAADKKSGKKKISKIEWTGPYSETCVGNRHKSKAKIQGGTPCVQQFFQIMIREGAVDPNETLPSKLQY